jgi:hypothetical protein
MGLTGASGYGSDWYYGPHVHQTLWPGAIWGAPTIDFQLYVSDEPAPGPRGEDEMTQSVSCNGNLYAIGEEFISHYATMQEADITRQVTSATDELHKLSLDEFTALLDGLGVPRNVLDGSGLVLNPQTGQYQRGGVWSRRREAVALLERLTAPPETVPPDGTEAGR